MFSISSDLRDQCLKYLGLSGNHTFHRFRFKFQQPAEVVSFALSITFAPDVDEMRLFTTSPILRLTIEFTVSTPDRWPYFLSSKKNFILPRYNPEVLTFELPDLAGSDMFLMGMNASAPNLSWMS